MWGGLSCIAEARRISENDCRSSIVRRPSSDRLFTDTVIRPQSSSLGHPSPALFSVDPMKSSGNQPSLESRGVSVAGGSDRMGAHGVILRGWCLFLLGARALIIVWGRCARPLQLRAEKTTGCRPPGRPRAVGKRFQRSVGPRNCLLYTSDAADDDYTV